MNPTVISLPESHQEVLDQTPEPQKVKVTLLDQDDLPMARGHAILPLLLGVGVFWPDCPMPGEAALATAKAFVLPTGESLRLSQLTLCAGDPPHYDFWVTQP